MRETVFRLLANYIREFASTLYRLFFFFNERTKIRRKKFVISNQYWSRVQSRKNEGSSSPRRFYLYVIRLLKVVRVIFYIWFLKKCIKRPTNVEILLDVISDAKLTGKCKVSGVHGHAHFSGLKSGITTLLDALYKDDC